MFQNTTATKKVFSLKKRIRAVAGGTSASKTISILIWLIDYCQVSENEVVTVVAESFPHLNLGAIRDFKAIMAAHGYWKDTSWNESNHTYKFPSGTILEFISFDKFGKAHGPRRDVLYLNEANNLPYEIADQLITRTRKIVWMDWNPSEEFWFYTEMYGKRDDVDFITLTYLDNEALDEVTIKEIESHKENTRWWKVYGLGQLGEIEGRVYTGWKIIQDIPHEARLFRRGLDFGYSIDPSALISGYEYNGGYILDENLYQKGMGNKGLADFVLNLEQPQTMVKADSAEPKSIDEMRSYGVNIIGATKGPGSVNQGINYVQSLKISVTSRSVNLIKSYRNYMYYQRPDGVYTNEPDDSVHEWSNCMDAVRYLFDGKGVGGDYSKYEQMAKQNVTQSVYVR